MQTYKTEFVQFQCARKRIFGVNTFNLQYSLNSLRQLSYQVVFSLLEGHSKLYFRCWLPFCCATILQKCCFSGSGEANP